MKVLKIILIALIVIVGLLLVVAAFLPDNAKMESTISIKASDNVIFNQVNNLKNWGKWTPFSCDDMSHVYSGATYGMGAISTWESDEMGNGDMEIVESIPFTSMSTSLDFREDGSANGHWEFEKVDSAVNIVWSIEMTNLSYPVGKLMGLLAGTMMQGYFDTGLSQLKETCEAMTDYSGILEGDINEVSAFTIIDSCKIEEIGELMGNNYGRIMKYLSSNNIEMTGVPFAIYHKWDPTGYIIIEAGIPADNSIGGKEDIIASSLKGGRVVKFLHMGPYENMTQSHELISGYIMDCGHTISGSPWEEYLSDPTTVENPEDIKTMICYPVE